MYVNASWLDDIRIFVVEYDHDVYLAGRERAEKVFAEDDPAMLAAEGKLDGMCAYCPFKDACAVVSTGRVPPKQKALSAAEVKAQDDDLVSELDEAVRRQQELKAKEKKLKKEIEAANEEVRQALIRRNKSRAVGAGWKVSYTTIAGRKTLSKAKMEEAGLDPEAYMEQGAGYEKLTITSEWEFEE
jgi:adenine-specific DNA glycosylase